MSDVVLPLCLCQCSVFCRECPSVIRGWGGQTEELLSPPPLVIPISLNWGASSEQGEMINRIEKNILSSADYVERGQEHVKMTLESQKKARKVSLSSSPPQPGVALPPLLSEFP